MQLEAGHDRASVLFQRTGGAASLASRAFAAAWPDCNAL